MPSQAENDRPVIRARPFPSVGVRLRWARQSVGLSQAQLAEKIGAWERTISYIEEGCMRREHGDRAVERLTQIAVAMGVQPEFLLMRDDEQGRYPHLVEVIVAFQRVASRQKRVNAAFHRACDQFHRTAMRTNRSER